MEMKKIKKRIKEIKKESKDKKIITIPDDMEVCPFMSTPTHEIACTSRCALYKGKGKKGYHCPLTELSSISWLMKGSPGANNYRKY